MVGIKWELVEHNHSNYINRAAVLGGWLVMSTDDVLESRGENSHMTGESGYQWRTSICFIPDPRHEWNLNENPLAHRLEVAG